MSRNQDDLPRFRREIAPLADYASIQNYQNIMGLEETSWGLGAAAPGPCLEPRTRLALHAGGGLFPCCSDFGRLAPLGFFPDQSLYEAWNSPAALELAQGESDRPACRLCRRASCPETSVRSQPVSSLLNSPPDGPGAYPGQASGTREIHHADSLSGQ
jgi:hypothetical protein